MFPPETKENKMIIPIKEIGNKVLLQCSCCGKPFKRYKKQFKPYSNFCYCSKKCQFKHAKFALTGNNNPNYGKKWSQKQKDHLSEIAKIRMQDPKYRYGNQPKTQEAKQRKSEKLRQKIYQRIANGEKISNHFKNTEESRKQHSEKMKIINHLPEYRLKVRKTKELKHQIIPLNEIPNYKVYKKLANWIQPMYDLITDQAQIDLYNKYGIFSSVKPNINLMGVQRDHKFSIYMGY